MTARCDLSDLPPDMCGHCTGAEERAHAEEHPAPSGLGPWFTARYDGSTCVNCGEDIVPGERIRSDGSSRYLCGVCGSADDIEELF